MLTVVSAALPSLLLAPAPAERVLTPSAVMAEPVVVELEVVTGAIGIVVVVVEDDSDVDVCAIAAPPDRPPLPLRPIADSTQRPRRTTQRRSARGCAAMVESAM